MPGRIQYDNESAVADAMGYAMAEDAWPGVFAGGKQIMATMKTRKGDFDVMSFRFDDGSEMNIVGKFEIRFKQSAASEARKQDLVEHGTQLMTGQLELPDAEG